MDFSTNNIDLRKKVQVGLPVFHQRKLESGTNLENTVINLRQEINKKKQELNSLNNNLKNIQNLSSPYSNQDIERGFREKEGQYIKIINNLKAKYTKAFIAKQKEKINKQAFIALFLFSILLQPVILLFLKHYNILFSIK